MRYLFILNDYFPLKNASGACVEMVIDVLLKHNHDVHILCALDDDMDIDKEGLLIHTVKTTNNQNVKGSNLKSLDVGLIKRLSLYISYLFNYPIQFPRDAKRYCDRAIALIKEYSIDIVVGVINPIETTVVLPRLKSIFNRLPLIVYELDSIGDLDNRNGGIRKLLNYKRRIIEKRLYNSADRIIYMKCHEKYFASKRFDTIRSKLSVSDFPMYNPKNEYSFNYISSDTICFIFSGSLYKTIREPQAVIEILKGVSKQLKITCSFFSKGSYEDYLKEEEKNTKGIIKRKGFVESRIIEKEYDQADILISIGNLMPNMVPSKLYAYMSYGKPIIHFSFIYNDPCNEILQNYPLALILSVDDSISINANRICSFIKGLESNNNHVIPDDLFPLNRPEYTEKLFTYE